MSAELTVTAVGIAGSFPGPDTASSCYLVQAKVDGETTSILLDLGNGALGPLQRFLDPTELDGILLTHLHADHCLDLTGLYVMQAYHPEGPKPVIPVWGPAGAPERFALLYEGLRDKDPSVAFRFHELAERSPVRVGPFTITPYAVRHPVETYGFRVECDGRVIAYTGDTDLTPALSPLLAGADLALVECAFVDGRDTVEGIHLSGSRAAAAVTAAGGVGRFVLTHLPSWNDPEVCLAQAREHYDGEVELAVPGTVYAL